MHKKTNEAVRPRAEHHQPLHASVGQWGCRRVRTISQTHKHAPFLRRQQPRRPKSKGFLPVYSHLFSSSQKQASAIASRVRLDAVFVFSWDRRSLKRSSALYGVSPRRMHARSSSLLADHARACLWFVAWVADRKKGGSVDCYIKICPFLCNFVCSCCLQRG